MFGEWLLSEIAWLEGFPPAQLATLEREWPNTKKLIDEIIASKTEIQIAYALYIRLLPLMKQASAEVKILTPVFEAVFAVIQKHTSVGKSPSDAAAVIKSLLATINPKGPNK